MSNCYDRIAHVIASVAFGAEQPATATESMLTTIQEMWCFLRAAYGVLKRCANSNLELEVKYQGLCQGNGAAPAGCAAMSITILMAHKADGHGATFVCPFTFTPSKSIDLAILFVFADDLDIIHVDMKQRETINEVYAALAASWNNLLMATGDTLNPDKCFYHM